jgi:asparagine N-glycosylation enzyme membrane subunit Stt3
LYFLAKRLYGPRVGILAAMFSALAVMQIQQSHFYTTDNFATFFMLLTAYFAVEILVCDNRPTALVANNETGLTRPSISARLGAYFSHLFADRLFWFSAAFGFALGLAMSSKLTAFPLAIVLPAALAVRYFGGKDAEPAQAGLTSPHARRTFEGFLSKMFVFMVVGGLFAFLAFRVFQPYAFSGLGLNPKWLSKNSKPMRARMPGCCGICSGLSAPIFIHLTT